MEAGKVRVLYEADTTKIDNANKKLEKSFDGFVSRATKLAGVLGLAFGAREIVQYGVHVVNTVGKLQDLAAQTGISAQTLSGFKSTIEENGQSLERFAKAVLFAQRNLGQAGDSGKRAAEAMAALGLNVDELRHATGEEFLEKFAKALSRVQDQNARAAIAFRVMGDAGAELIPVLLQLSNNFDELKNSGLSQETIRAIDDVGDAFTRLSNILLNLSATSLANFLKDIGVAKRTVEEIQRDIDATIRFAPGDVGKIQRLERELAEARERIDEKDKAGFPSGFKFGDDKTKKALEEAAKRNAAFAASLKESSNALQQQLIGMIMGPEAAEAYSLELLEAKAAVDGLTTAEKEQLARHQRLVRNLRERTRAYDQLQRAVDATRDSGLQEEITFGLTPSESAEALSAWDQYVQKIEDARAALRQLRDDELARMHDQDFEEMARAPQELGEFLLRQQDQRDAEQEGLASAFGSDIGDPFRGAASELLRGSKNFENVFRMAIADVFFNVGDRILEESLFKPLENALTNAIQSLISNVSGSLGGGATAGIGAGGGGDFLSSIGGFFSSIFGGLFHQGGLVTMHAGGFRPDERLARLQAGEFVFSRAATAAIGGDMLSYMNESGRMPGGGTYVPQAPNVGVRINGDIIPRKPGMSKDDVVQIILQDYEIGGPLRQGARKIIGR
ncbi:MAG: hypothetical protein ACREQ7_12820 [Candidatus Binatia bacterium]